VRLCGKKLLQILSSVVWPFIPVCLFPSIL
jgi:hypothetical protein